MRRFWAAVLGDVDGLLDLVIRHPGLMTGVSSTRYQRGVARLFDFAFPVAAPRIHFLEQRAASFGRIVLGEIGQTTVVARPSF